MKKIDTPFFVCNPKSYIYGEDVLALGKEADKLAKKYAEVEVFFTAPYTDLRKLSNNIDNIIMVGKVNKKYLYEKHNLKVLKKKLEKITQSKNLTLNTS